MNQKGISLVVIILIIIGILVVAGGLWYWQSQKEKPVACTQDAKLCPDGSYVSRTGPNCEFAACPEVKDETANWQTYRNEKYGFEVKYPNDWLVDKNQPIFTKYNCKYDISQVDGQVYLEKESFKKEGCSSKLIQQNGINFEKIECPTGWSFVKYYFKKNDKYFLIEVEDAYKPGEPEPFFPGYMNCYESFDQILSTFKFTE